MNALGRSVALAGLIACGLTLYALAQAPPPKQPAPKAPAPVAKAPAAPAPAAVPARKADPLDWTTFRGPNGNNSSNETGLIDTFKHEGGEGSNVKWKRDDIWSISTPIVMNGKLYILARSEPGKMTECERVVCIDAVTGKDIWQRKFQVSLSSVPDTRVSWSNMAGDPETGRVYAQCVNGLFVCLEGDTGKTVWSIPMHEQYGLLTTYGGRTNSPIIDGDRVIISGVLINWGEHSIPAHRFIALNKATGEQVWLTSTRLRPEDTTYSTPVIATVRGERQLIAGGGDGAGWGLQPETGKPIWMFKFSPRGINTSPVLVGDQVLFTNGEEVWDELTKMGSVALINIPTIGQVNPMDNDITKTNEAWRTIELVMAGKSTPHVIDGQIYTIDDSGKMFTLDLKTGEQLGKKLSLGTVMKSTPLYADGKLYVFTGAGQWAILEPQEGDSPKILVRGRMADKEEVQGSPIVSHGRIYLPSTAALYCLEDPSQQHGVKPAAPPPVVTPVGPNDPPAQLLVYPSEILMKPGESFKFTAKLYNARGQYLRDDPTATFEATGPGSFEGSTLRANPMAKHQVVMVTAKSGALTGKARVRVIPPLPWSFDFENTVISADKKAGTPPPTWVGMSGRHVVREVDGNKVMVKVTTIPKGTRSRGFFGPSDLSEYTIQADVLGQIKDGKMPDVGLIAQGYVFDIQGASQNMNMRTWDAQLHNAKVQPFPWKPGQWYTMKFTVHVEGDKAQLKGKVWPKGSAEPAAWTMQHEIAGAETHGSPGMYADATNAEIFIDNITVTANK